MKQITEFKNGFSRFTGREFRPGQEEAIRFILESRKPVAVIQAPTGSGKSLIGMVAGKALLSSGDSFCYLVGSKALQRQLGEDFPEAMEMRGRNNFPCLQYDHLDASQCTHNKKNPCPYKKECPYDVHKRLVVQHPIQILNYAYFLYEANFVGQFTGYPIMIIDEGDSLENALMDFIQLSISRKDLDYLAVDPPEYKTTSTENGVVNWQEWAGGTLLPQVFRQIQTLERRFEDAHDTKIASLLQHYRTVAVHAQMLEEYVDRSWIMEVDMQGNQPSRWRFSPAWITTDLVQQYLFRHAKRVVLMSATFPTRTVLAKTLGITPEEIDFLEVPSTFPVENRRVFLHPVADMRNGTIERDLPRMLREIRNILAQHPGEKGIIHCHSWRLTQAVLGIGNARLVSHNSHDKELMLSRFKNSPDPLVWVSPSSDRGVDLPDDLCRFIVMAKAPFQHVKSKQVEKRRYETPGNLGRLWFLSDCAQAIVQACGRGVRHQDDRCVTYILDKAICDLVTNRQSLFPRYFLEEVDIV